MVLSVDVVDCVSTTIRLKTVGASSTMPDTNDDDAVVSALSSALLADEENGI